MLYSLLGSLLFFLFIRNGHNIFTDENTLSLGEDKELYSERGGGKKRNSKDFESTKKELRECEVTSVNERQLIFAWMLGKS